LVSELLHQENALSHKLLTFFLYFETDI